jgi:PP-loop superfamily ATP-utilizing enzyme
MERGPWGVVAYRAISEAARAEAERIRREIEERRAAEAKALAERQRRCCNYCARLEREVIDERRKLANLVCAVDGHTIASLFAPACEHWRDEREREEQ